MEDGQTSRRGRGRAWWPVGLVRPGGGGRHQLDEGWRPGRASRTGAGQVWWPASLERLGGGGRPNHGRVGVGRVA
jgi:hypothetical protein